MYIHLYRYMSATRLHAFCTETRSFKNRQIYINSKYKLEMIPHHTKHITSIWVISMISVWSNMLPSPNYILFVKYVGKFGSLSR